MALDSPRRTACTRLVSGLRESVRLFRDLDDQTLEELAEIGEERSISAQVDLFRMGDPGDALYCILEGTVSLRVQDDAGDCVEVAVQQAGDIVGEIALIDGGPRSATVTSTEACRLFVIERRAFLNLLTKSPNLLANLLVRLTTTIRTDATRFLENALEQQKVKTQQEIDRRRTLSQMVAGVAHEINTPLGIANHAASIVSELATGLAEELGQESKRETLDDILSACRLMHQNICRADHLVQTFKTLSVSQSRDKLEKVHLRKITQDVVELYRLKARSSGLTVQVIDKLGQDEDEWEGYPGHYSQVLLNLLTNIDRYAYPDGTGGKVDIELSILNRREDSGCFSVIVRDFGCGIARDHLEHVFEPFFTQGRGKGGTGLGLSIVKNLVTDSLQGEIRITSKLGEGTEVFLILPKVIGPPAGS